MFCCCAETRTCCGVSSLGLRLSTHEQNPNSPLVGQAVPVFSLRVCVCVCCLCFSLFCSFLQAVLTTCPLLKVGTRESERECVRERACKRECPGSLGLRTRFPVLFPPVVSLPPVRRCFAARRRRADGAVRSPPGGEILSTMYTGWVGEEVHVVRKEGVDREGRVDAE